MLQSEDDLFCITYGVIVAVVCPQCNYVFPKPKTQVCICPACANMGLQDEFRPTDWKFMEPN